MKKILLISYVVIMLLTGSNHAVHKETPTIKPQARVDMLRILPLPKPVEVPVEVVEVKEEKNYSDEDLYWLSRIVSAEAKGESLDGQIAVANVVLNRSKATGKSIKEVIFTKGQFSPVANKTIHNEPIESAIDASVKALEGTKVIDDNVMYFYAPKFTSRGNWIRKRKVHKQIGNHIFSY